MQIDGDSVRWETHDKSEVTQVSALQSVFSSIKRVASRLTVDRRVCVSFRLFAFFIFFYAAVCSVF